MDIKNTIDDIFLRESNKDVVLGYLKFIFLACVIILFGIYIGNTLFGDSSIEVLLELEDNEEFYISEIEKLGTSNEILQKKFFELKQLEPDF